MNNKEIAKEATQKMTSLYVFEAIVGALEKGTIRGEVAEKASSKIINIAANAQGELLKEYDDLIDKMTT